MALANLMSPSSRELPLLQNRMPHLPIDMQVFRLHWPEEVRAEEAKCQRSQTTGELLVTVPVARRGGPLQALRAHRSHESQVAGATQAVTTMTTTRNPSVAPTPAPRRGNVRLGDEVRRLRLAGLTTSRATLQSLTLSLNALVALRSNHTRADAGAVRPGVAARSAPDPRRRRYLFSNRAAVPVVGKCTSGGVG